MFEPDKQALDGKIVKWVYAGDYVCTRRRHSKRLCSPSAGFIYNSSGIVLRWHKLLHTAPAVPLLYVADKKTIFCPDSSRLRRRRKSIQTTLRSTNWRSLIIPHHTPRFSLNATDNPTVSERCMTVWLIRSLHKLLFFCAMTTKCSVWACMQSSELFFFIGFGIPFQR